jgi:hypothetical protein
MLAKRLELGVGSWDLPRLNHVSRRYRPVLEDDACAVKLRVDRKGGRMHPRSESHSSPCLGVFLQFVPHIPNLAMLKPADRNCFKLAQTFSAGCYHVRYVE